MTRRQMAAGFALAAAVLLGAASIVGAETAQPVPARAVTQRAPRPPEAARIGQLPDLAVTAAKVSLTCVRGNSVKAVISATFENLSTRSADLSNVPWQVIVKAEWSPRMGSRHLVDPDKETIMPTASAPVLWRPGQNLARTLTIHGIPKYKKTAPQPRQYGFAVRVDPKNLIAESDESNNAGIATALDPCPH
jgi:hypothetical protein